jgi:hypothetical protein
MGMKRMGLKRGEVLALGLAIVALGVGVGVLWFMHEIVGVEAGAAFAALLALPVLAYAIASGRIRELTAGSLSVKFVEVANAPATIAAEDVEVPIQKAPLLKAGGKVEQTETWLGQFDPGQPSVLRVDVGLGANVCKGDEMLAITGLVRRQLPKFRFVVFLAEDRVLGFMPAQRFEQLLRHPRKGHEFVAAVNAGRAGEILRADGMLRPNCVDDVTTRQVLAELEELDLDSLVVVDRMGRFRGVVERDQVVCQMMLALVR